VSLFLFLFVACLGADKESLVDSNAIDTAPNEVPLVVEAAAYCGECHPDHFNEWRESMHAYATRSPVFDAMAGKAFRDSAGEVDTFCTRCHSLPGEAAGDKGDTPFAERSAIGREGVTCDVCHTVSEHGWPLGNANLMFDPEGPKVGPYADVETMDHGAAQSDLITSSEFCGSCHDVFAYPGIAIEQAYSEFAEGPASKAGQRCQDCHMSPSPGLPVEREYGPIAEVDGEIYPSRERSTHRFVGPDYPLVDDWPYPDDFEANASVRTESLARTQALLEAAVEIVNPSILDLENRIQASVTLRSLTDGHRVPTGFTSERQLWIDLSLTDNSGHVLLRSGDLDAYGDLRNQHSLEVRLGEVEEDTQLHNLQSRNRILSRKFIENGEFNSDILSDEDAIFPFEAITIERNSLKPGEERVVTYDTERRGKPPFTLTATLRYRNLPPYVLRALQMDDYVDKLVVFDLGTVTKEHP
jgi:hypothetical protein